MQGFKSVQEGLRTVSKGKGLENNSCFPATCFNRVTQEKRVKLEQCGSNPQMQLGKACFTLGVGAK